MSFNVDAKSNSVEILLQKKLYPIELLQGAAYLLTDRATAYVEEKKGGFVVTLEAKDKTDAKTLAVLAREFLDELLNQSLRQRLAAANRSVTEHIITRAMVSARIDPEDASQPAQASEESLSAEQLAEIDRLIAEAEAEISGRAKERVTADPLGITKTWEEKYGKNRTG